VKGERGRGSGLVSVVRALAALASPCEAVDPVPGAMG
jgi:hypothetical protein